MRKIETKISELQTQIFDIERNNQKISKVANLIGNEGWEALKRQLLDNIEKTKETIINLDIEKIDNVVFQKLIYKIQATRAFLRMPEESLEIIENNKSIIEKLKDKIELFIKNSKISEKFKNRLNFRR